MRRLRTAVRRPRTGVVLRLFDLPAWLTGLVVAVALRYDGNVAAVGAWPLVGLAGAAVSLQWLLGWTFRLYDGRSAPGTAAEAVQLAWIVLSVGVVLVVPVGARLVPGMPRSASTVAAAVVIVELFVVRQVWRRLHERVPRGLGRDDAPARVVVLGAGDAGTQLIRSMLVDAERSYLPVALLDDDPALRWRRVGGLRVTGTSADLERTVRSERADLLVIAIRCPDHDLIRTSTCAVAPHGVRVQVLRGLGEQLAPALAVSDLRDLDVNDLLGRAPRRTDLALAARCIRGRRVLVTGAGGSIGSELCRQIAALEPRELMMLDRDESALHGVQLSLTGSALLDTDDVILADIRDLGALDEIFARRRPEVVFHAAALKHLPMLEQYPREAWKTNVVGTGNIVHVCLAHDVDRLVNISTDKAADPVSVLGCSKRVGERLVAGAARDSHRAFLSVRFGNVLGSRGSVLTTFLGQLVAGLPLTITHPDVSRFFMTIPEAVQLVLQATAIGGPGEVLVLDMGEPVRITDVARQLMSATGLNSPIVYTGLRPGEKLHEDLFGEGETDERPVHSAISQVAVPPLPPLEELADELPGGRVQPVDAAGAMRLLCAARAATVTERSARGLPVGAASRGEVVR